MSDKSGHDHAGAPRITLKTRLHAWWEGYDLSGLKGKGGEEGGKPPSAAAPAQPAARGHGPGLNRWGKPLWSATRIEVAEKLWGEGFNTPGGHDHIPYLVKPLGLNPAMSVLDLSAGLGGTSRTMASKYGCWVTGLEASESLAKEGMIRSFKEGLEKKAPIETYDPENFSYAKRVDAIVYKEGMFSVDGKDQLFDGMELALKPRGHLLMTDYVIDPALAGARAVQVWCDKEPMQPHLWSKDQMAAAFAQRNLDLRIAEDITDTHRGLIVSAIQGLVEHLERHHLDHGTKLAVMDEVELWVRRVSAIEAGMRVCRFYALKPAE
ncbi:phosphoethanolamine methyltransferase [Azospirillum sp. TSH58]|uniref:SAM-dependent methyltransferase n=1 Tax=Azospirillum sp. TSH58 TaxID=664962 RepID=UPI000D5FED66|nr:methyltransferase domain-containing protein [Azospirillum sp. TSH58]AWJ83388.1 phosphoethanolamine methyltransferase [Azospirillum sp. TSH58]PWC73132.1 phosphoethanolamine methyltransferase [Azospirillum sp. TSH58]